MSNWSISCGFAFAASAGQGSRVPCHVVQGTPADPSHTPVKPPPSFLQQADTARWLVHEATWGTFATTSVQLKGLPFASPVSFAGGTDDDATGTPFFCVSPLVASMRDIATSRSPEFYSAKKVTRREQHGGWSVKLIGGSLQQQMFA